MLESSKKVYEAALEYDKLGFSVIPVSYGTKKPSVEWKQFQERRPSQAELKAWFDNGIEHNIGVVCGPISGNLTVLDFDDDDAAQKFLTDGFSEIQQATPVAKTSRGYHIYFRTQEPVRSFNVPELKLNVLGVGHFVMAAPSKHPDGMEYCFVTELKPPLEIEHLEKSIRDRCKALGAKVPSTPPAAGATDEKTTVKPWRRLPAEAQAYFNPVKKGERADRAFKLACLLVSEWKFRAETALEWLTTWNQDNESPLELSELQHAIDSAKDGYVFSKETFQPQLQGQPVKEPTSKWILSFAKRKMPADLVAEQLLELYRIATLKDTGEVFVYQAGIYQKGGDTTLAARVEEEARQQGKCGLVKIGLLRETIEHVKRRTYRDRKEFDTDPRIINLKNGLLNVDTLNFTEHTPDYLSVNQLPVSYDRTGECPKIMKFLSEVAFPEDIAALQQMVGYTLWKGYPAHIAIMLIGDGSNGKSTFINLIKALLGTDNISSCSLQELVMNRFAQADLYGKSANLYADLSDQALKMTGPFKMVTGNDPIRGEQKFRNAFVFVNYAKLIFSANKVPEVYEDSLAFFRRWILFTFPNTFTGEKENKNLLSTLTTSEEMSGFLNWALRGLQQLRANKWTFSNSKSVAQVREEYIRKSSPIQAFIMDCVHQDSNGTVPKKLMFSKFCDYCRTYKLPTVTKDTFWKRLPEFIRYEESYETIDKKRTHCVKGWTIKPEQEWGKQEDNETRNTETLEQTAHPEQPVQPVQPVQGLEYFGSHLQPASEPQNEVSAVGEVYG
jgi:putative DNA primase/helicase